MASLSKPVFVIVPGASQNPAHYGYLQHLLLKQGYGVLSALLPSIGNASHVTAEDDTEYVRSRMLLPLLDVQGHDVIIFSHSYGGLPASAAARGLSKKERAAEGKATAVIGQIFLASILPRGGDGQDVFAIFGGRLQPFIRAEEAENLTKCDDPKPPLYHDLSPELADGAASSALAHGLTSFKSPCPPASWHADGFKGRCAYIRTVNDQAHPYERQTELLQKTGEDWLIRDIDTGHSPQLAAPEKLTGILVELAQQFEGL